MEISCSVLPKISGGGRKSSARIRAAAANLFYNARQALDQRKLLMTPGSSHRRYRVNQEEPRANLRCTKFVYVTVVDEDCQY
jgi:hypothetical protein